jgi:ABC-type transporter Mla subunit MlaD
MAGMGEVIDELRAASGAFANLQPLVTSMSRATDSIEAAMRQLPEDLRSSMSNVTSGMVSQLNDTLGESAEYTKKILAIYAEQELRVKGLHSIVNSSQAALAEIKDTHKILEQLPGQMAHLSNSAASIAASNQEMSGKLGLFPIGALAEASVALVEGQSVLLASADKLQSAYVKLNSVLPNGHMTAADGKL